MDEAAPSKPLAVHTVCTLLKLNCAPCKRRVRHLNESRTHSMQWPEDVLALVWDTHARLARMPHSANRPRTPKGLRAPFEADLVATDCVTRSAAYESCGIHEWDVCDSADVPVRREHALAHLIRRRKGVGGPAITCSQCPAVGTTTTIPQAPPTHDMPKLSLGDDSSSSCLTHPPLLWSGPLDTKTTFWRGAVGEACGIVVVVSGGG